ncbi:MAG: phosphoethanolamine transferase [Prevotella sp.]|nr:phosphoethanolamine transferase [Prevotella sp.]
MKKTICILLFTLLLAIPSMYHFDSRGLVVTAFVQALSYSILLLYLSNKSKIARIIIYTILYVLFTLETFTFIHFGSRLDPNILTLILQTDLQEIKGFFSLYVFSVRSVFYFVIVILLYYLFLKHIVISDFTIWFRKKALNVLLLFITFFGIAIPILPLPCQKGYTTIQEVYHSINTVGSYHQDVTKIEAMIGEVAIINSPTKEESPVIVLVIGESFNRHHSQLYGYTLNTSPWLSKEEHLIVFKNAISPTNVTHLAMKFLFTLKSCDKEVDTCQYVLMPVVFKKAHYQVAYFDNQYTRSEGGIMDYGCGYFLNPKKINMSCFDYRNDKTFDYDGDFINYYKSRFYFDNKSLNIIHLMGQHLPAKMRYPNGYEKFTSSDILRNDLDEKQKSLIAEYDNATLYNDYVVHQIINSFRQTDAVIIYLSDHGENIYDGKTHTLGRTFDKSNETEAIENIYHIPFVVWCSDTFVAKHPEKYESLKLSSDKTFCSDDIPFLLFDIASIDMNFNNETRSVIGDKYIPHKTNITQL